MNDRVEAKAAEAEEAIQAKQVEIAEFWQWWVAEKAEPAPSKELAPIETQEVVVREIPTAAETAADAVLAANLREELEDMWNTRRDDPDEFYENLDDSRATLERLIKKHNKKTGYVEPQPQPALPTRQQHRDEAMVETSQYPRLDALFRP